MSARVAVRGPRSSREDLVDPEEKWDAPTAAQLEAMFGEGSGRSDDFALYTKRVQALDRYRALATGDAIKKETGVDILQVRRLHERARKTNPVTGRPNGYWVCVPTWVRRKPAHLRVLPFDEKLAEAGLGYKGALQSFLSLHSDIETRFLFYLRTRKVSRDAAPEPRITAARAVVVFHFFCREKGLDKHPEKWPYCTSRAGENAIRAYYARWKLKYPAIATANELGADAAREHRIDTAVALNSVPTNEPPPMLYGRVEVDGHKLHAIGEVAFKNKYGIEVIVELRRVYALVMVAANIPLVLAARSCFGLRYDANDVLGLVHEALFPPERRKKFLIDHPEYRYLEDADYPGNAVPELRGNCWQELAWDADSAQISAAKKAQIELLLKCKVSVERVGSPTARTFIERFNGFLARVFEILASGTGSHPRDPARNEPEKAATKYRISIELLDELLDLFVRNWNATFHQELGTTPLDAARQLITSKRLHPNNLGELEPDTKRTDRYYELYPSFERELCLTRRRQGVGHGVLVVNLFGAKYCSDELVGNKLLLATSNKRCTVYVNPLDARHAWIVPDAYPEMSIHVVVQNKALLGWEHALHWRVQACAWVAGRARREKALTPDLMAAAAEGLGNQAAAGDPQARAAFSTILGEQARIAAGAVSAMDDEPGLPEPVIDQEEAEDVQPDPELVASADPAAPAPAAAPSPNSKGAGGSGRRSSDSPPASTTGARSATNRGPKLAPSGKRAPLLRPPVPGDSLGMGGRS